MLAFFHRLKGCLQYAFCLGIHTLHIFRRNDFLALQPFGVHFVDCRVIPDFAVDKRLSSIRVVHLIMAVTAVADQINHEILFE
ncbi:hypothetical protein D3C81_1535340 [compost metagenome]